MSKHANLSIFVPHVGCPHKCSFCNQNTITGSSDIPHAADVKAVCEQAISEGVDPKETEIAFFGGSFTAVPRAYMLELLEAAREYVKKGFSGVRLSTRPDAITPEILGILKKYGVTSIELGAQSMCDDVLSANERGHTAKDVSDASKLIKDYGFSLGLQMMVGLYKSTPEKDIYTAKKLIELEPSEVRIYPVVVLENTKLGELYKSGEYKTYSLETGVEVCATLLDMFERENIRVIKLGLHASCDVEHDMLGGIYHPALRELCEGIRFRRCMERLAADSGVRDRCTFLVNPRDLSKALGQHRCNIVYFKSKGIDVTVKPDAKVAKGVVLSDTEGGSCT
ncbi:MAG TPA: radical SAM protein [Candidatus Faeciplasma gallinarum]|uniref:Radical SAM protein n=1 Tax=Candidatus Faeciplasma gallinarum TaxID=2840799 RepID=A0A9D1EN19_9FIRM|nr:radical SAM protein [Candidatus Faeciplasma gallinarum]